MFKYIKFPKLEDIKEFTTYGNKYMSVRKNTLTRSGGLIVVICGERKEFLETCEGIEEAEKWMNEKRQEIGKALKLLEVEE